MRNASLLVITFFFCLITHAQKKVDGIKLFLDCNAYCDMSFIKTEINYVDFVPDRFTSNLYVMLTSQETGSGGQELMLYFSGQGALKGMEDTLKFIRSSVATDAEYRTQLVKYLKLGITRYVARSGMADKLTITAESGTGEKLNATTAKKDPWNYWVMNVRLNGNYRKDDYTKFYRYSSSFEASKTTEKIKINNNFYYNKNVSEITVGTKRVFRNDGYGANSTIVKAINQHWSFGGSGRFENSSFTNYASRLQVSPAVEYSFFPYADAVKKAVTLYYEAGNSWNRYIDSSFYGNLQDQTFRHSLSLNFGFIQKWGNINTNVTWESFLNDFRLEGKRIKGSDVRMLSIGGNMDIRIFKGLSFYSYFGYDITKGVYPNLRRADFNLVDILSNTVQYPTTNSLYTYFGISYRFGSIYNNVVNPRFNRNR